MRLTSASSSTRNSITASSASPRSRQHAVERRGLRHGAREAVEDEALAGVGLLDALGDDADHDVVGHQAAARHDLLRLQADRRAGLHRRAQHVAGRELD